MPTSNKRRVDAGRTIMTPVEVHGGYLVKRDDLADECGVRGGKARTLGVICRHVVATGLRGVTIYASRNSVTPAALGAVCYAHGVRACVHTAASREPMSEAFLDAVRNGVDVVEHRPGYMSVLASRARAQAAADGYLMVELGLDFPPAVDETAKQVANLPHDMGRLVTAVGSGHMLEGILRGMEGLGLTTPVLGVCVGKVPECIVNMETPIDVELITSEIEFSKKAPVVTLGELELNPYYEAKCIPHLKRGDLLWVVAK